MSTPLNGSDSHKPDSHQGYLIKLILVVSSIQCDFVDIEKVEELVQY